MTNKTKYSNISVSKKTYADLQKISKEILPGRTPLSISKTVDVLVNEKLHKNDNSLKTLKELDYQTESTGFTPPKNIINWVKKNSEKNRGDKNDG